MPKSIEDARNNGHGHSHNNVDVKKESAGSQMNMRGVFLHVMADALGSVVVCISALIMWLTEWEYKHYVDPGMLKNKTILPDFCPKVNFSLDSW